MSHVYETKQPKLGHFYTTNQEKRYIHKKCPTTVVVSLYIFSYVRVRT